MKGRGCLTTLLIVAILGYFAYRIIVPTYNWRQKISVVVETPNGEISAYSVQHIIAQKGPGVPNQGSNTAIDLKAEAVVIQLNESDYLFALINNSASLVPYLAAPRKGVRSHEGLGAADSLPVGTTFTLTGGTFPLLVTFDDITKPETVKRADPDDLDASLGLCADGSGLQDKDAPWRAEGLIWRAWVRKGIQNAARKKAMAEAQIEPEMASVLLGLRYFWLSTYGGYESQEAKKIEAVGPKMEQRERYKLLALSSRNFDPSKISPRDTSNDCHRLKSITLEITDEPVTTGKVEEVLGNNFFRTWGTIHQNALKHEGIKGPFFKTLMSKLARNDFIKE